MSTRFLFVFAILVMLHGSARGLEAWLRVGDMIEGESAHPQHPGWSDLEGFSVHPSKERFTMTCHKPVDRASPLFLKACVDEKSFDTAVIEVARLVGGEHREFWRLSLRNVRITGCERSGGEGGVEERLELTWSAHVVDYRVIPVSGEEYVISRLVSPDDDGDSLPNAYEADYGLDPTKSNRGVDSDGDGLVDDEEYRLGTNPSSPTSFFVATASDEDPGDGTVELSWPSVAGKKYSVLFSPDLAAPFSLLEEVTATSSQTTYNATRVLPVGFFKVESPANP